MVRATIKLNLNIERCKLNQKINFIQIWSIQDPVDKHQVLNQQKIRTAFDDDIKHKRIEAIEDMVEKEERRKRKNDIRKRNQCIGFRRQKNADICENQHTK